MFNFTSSQSLILVVYLLAETREANRGELLDVKFGVKRRNGLELAVVCQHKIPKIYCPQNCNISVYLL